MQPKSLLISLLSASCVGAQSLTSVLQGNSDLSTLTSTLQKFPSLLQSLGSASNITILAPTNEAFNALFATPAGMAAQNDDGLLQAVLQYHVINGTYPASSIPSSGAFVPTLLTNSSYTNVTGGQRVEGISQNGNVTFFSGGKATSNVTQADVKFDGGIIHVINAVLTVPANITSTAQASGLSTLASALTQTNLLNTVNVLPDITVFAPTNQAFAAINSTIAMLSTQQLASVLEYHVINGTVAYSTTLMDGETVPTLNGATVKITLANGGVKVNQATVTIADVLVANGVVHVIDG
ncbi:beta-Ig-H3/fasciclin [Viridothelium virens]|uniref:Beta-Ig-H3/fasciclin n=1 Tax=Viridothelium virens TaxID=1048519 RepID=A0A6A6HEM6_VIRVR|nr:beta-Ig-H3/fasciclin [Viridothelium virens]